MSFLNQLKSQAQALQSQQAQNQRSFEDNIAQTESACKSAWAYLQDLARQLNVITPMGPEFSVDGKTPWPAMRLVDFRVDARKKMLRDKEVFDYLNIGWDILPVHGKPIEASVRVNFPPDLERVQKRLQLGGIPHERKEVRHPVKNTLLAYCFEFTTQARGGVVITPDHDNGSIGFRLINLSGFEVATTRYSAPQVGSALMDELAKRIVQQPSRFL